MGSRGLFLNKSTGTLAVEDCISRTGTRTVLECSVSIELSLEQYRICRTGTGAVMASIISEEFVMGH